MAVKKILFDSKQFPKSGNPDFTRAVRSLSQEDRKRLQSLAQTDQLESIADLGGVIKRIMAKEDPGVGEFREKVNAAIDKNPHSRELSSWDRTVVIMELQGAFCHMIDMSKAPDKKIREMVNDAIQERVRKNSSSN